MTVKQAMKENKLISTILAVLAAGLMAWGVWVTDGIYSNNLTRVIELRTVCADVEKLRVADERLQREIKAADEKLQKEMETAKLALQQEIKEERQVMATFQKEILLMFIAIQKQIREK